METGGTDALKSARRSSHTRCQTEAEEQSLHSEGSPTLTCFDEARRKGERLNYEKLFSTRVITHGRFSSLHPYFFSSVKDAGPQEL